MKNKVIIYGIFNGNVIFEQKPTGNKRELAREYYRLDKYYQDSGIDVHMRYEDGTSLPRFEEIDDFPSTVGCPSFEVFYNCFNSFLQNHPKKSE